MCAAACISGRLNEGALSASDEDLEIKHGSRYR